MIASKLPYDCLKEVFEHVLIYSTHRHPKNLFSCLLVNKLWSKLVVPLLWKYPWQWRGGFSASPVFWKAITKTIISCLSEEQKSRIFLSLPNLSPPTYDYIKYCEHLSPKVIESIIEALEILQLNHDDIKNFENSIIVKINRSILQIEFWKFFMNKCLIIKSLELPNISIINYPGATNCLSSLEELECCTLKSSKLFKELVPICHNIRFLCVSCDEDNDGLSQLIISQHALLEFRCISLNGEICTKIGQALTSQAHSLDTLNLENSLCFSAAILKNFINLTELNIIIDDKIPSDLNTLRLVTLPNLRNLYIECNNEYPPLDIYVGLIERTRGELIKVEINSSHYLQRKEYFSILIRSIFTSCRSLKVVCVYYTDKVKMELEELIKICKNLEEITINGRKLMENENSPLAKSVFEILLKHGTENLQELALLGEWKSSQDEISNNSRQLALLPIKITNDAKGSWEVIIPWKGHGLEPKGTASSSFSEYYFKSSATFKITLENINAHNTLIQCYSSITTTTGFKNYLHDSQSFMINRRKLDLLPTKIINIDQFRWELIVPWKGTGFDEEEILRLDLYCFLSVPATLKLSSSPQFYPFGSKEASFKLTLFSNTRINVMDNKNILKKITCATYISSANSTNVLYDKQNFGINLYKRP
ncbi:3020_t:CDS:2 [Diversispora eburnea]|uniref:3020_t:CDS:1 n=1 Tax=Diversispora eburnea TaxID=1213867 RepID=A0A9N9AEU6_9GLOM|nr:3020_t:CDS:2 [Diversispora eburnea]